MKARTFALKLAHGTTIKRVRKSPRDMLELEQLIHAELPELRGTPFCIQYVDSEEDVITVTTTEGLREAYFQLKDCNKTVLRFTIKMVEPQKNEESLIISNILPVKNGAAEALAIDKANNTELEEDADKRTVHQGIGCRKCQAFPIVGTRYRCSVCPNYSICEACEEKGAHSKHVFLKIVTESQLQPFLYDKPRREEIKKEKPKQSESKEENKKKLLNKSRTAARAREAMAVVLGDATKEVAGVSGEILILNLSYNNQSEVQWPTEPHIVRTEGTIQFDMIPVPERLQPGGMLTLSIPIELPVQVGDYKLKLRFKDENAFFGQTVLVLIKVLKAINTE